MSTKITRGYADYILKDTTLSVLCKITVSLITKTKWFVPLLDYINIVQSYTHQWKNNEN